MPFQFKLWHYQPRSGAIQYKKFRRKNPTIDLHEHSSKGQDWTKTRETFRQLAPLYNGLAKMIINRCYCMSLWPIYVHFGHFPPLLRKTPPEQSYFSPYSRFVMYPIATIAISRACQTLEYIKGCCLISFLCGEDNLWWSTTTSSVPIQLPEIPADNPTNTQIATEPPRYTENPRNFSSIHHLISYLRDDDLQQQ